MNKQIARCGRRHTKTKDVAFRPFLPVSGFSMSISNQLARLITLSSMWTFKMFSPSDKMQFKCSLPTSRVPPYNGKQLFSIYYEGEARYFHETHTVVSCRLPQNKCAMIKIPVAFTQGLTFSYVTLNLQDVVCRVQSFLQLVATLHTNHRCPAD